jgi:hypothetical protein
MERSNQNPPDKKMRDAYLKNSDPYRSQIPENQQPTAYLQNFRPTYHGHSFVNSFPVPQVEPTLAQKETMASAGRIDAKALQLPEYRNQGYYQHKRKVSNYDGHQYPEYLAPSFYHQSTPLDYPSHYTGYQPYSYPPAPYYSYSSPSYPYFYLTPGHEQFGGYMPYPPSQIPMGGVGLYPPYGYDNSVAYTQGGFQYSHPEINQIPSKPQIHNALSRDVQSSDNDNSKKEIHQNLVPPVKDIKPYFEPPKVAAEIRAKSQPSEKHSSYETIKKEQAPQPENRFMIEPNVQLSKIPQPDLEQKSDSEESESSNHEASDEALSQLQRPSIMSDRMPDPSPNSMVLKIRPPLIFLKNANKGFTSDIGNHSHPEVVDLRKRSEILSWSGVSGKEKGDHILKLQSKKVKTFWKGINFTFPDTFKRRYEFGPNLGDRSYVTEIIDLSSKTLANDQYIHEIDVGSEY